MSHPQDLNHHPRGPNPIVYVHTGHAGGTGIQHGQKRGKAVLPYPVDRAGRHCDDRAGVEAWREEEEEEVEEGEEGGEEEGQEVEEASTLVGNRSFSTPGVSPSPPPPP